MYANASAPLDDAFGVQLPFYQNPLKTAGIVLGALILLGLGLTRRGPTGFVLRRVAGKRWSLEKGVPRLRLTISTELGTTQFSLESPTGQSTIQLATELPTAGIDEIARSGLARLGGLPRRYTGTNLVASFNRELDLIGRRIFGEALPDAVRFAFSQVQDGTVQMVLRDSVLNVPWEIAAHDDLRALGLRFGMARLVSSDRFAAKKGDIATKLRVVLFAPSSDGTAAPLKGAAEEVRRISRRVARWGAEVIVLRPDCRKEEVIEALCSAHFFHYAGHAEFDSDRPDKSFLPLASDRISAEEIHEALSERENKLLLAFVNGCGSSREQSWRRGEAVFGLASAFLRNATYFVGAQWPIQDAFAVRFAEEFYSHLLPTSGTLWWRWLRREQLSGLELGEAIRIARERLSNEDARALPTWQAYVYYGDATSRLVMR
jgi:hypothetical protein